MPPSDPIWPLGVRRRRAPKKLPKIDPRSDELRADRDPVDVAGLVAAAGRRPGRRGGSKIGPFLDLPRP